MLAKEKMLEALFENTICPFGFTTPKAAYEFLIRSLPQNNKGDRLILPIRAFPVDFSQLAQRFTNLKGLNLTCRKGDFLFLEFFKNLRILILSNCDIAAEEINSKVCSLKSLEFLDLIECPNVNDELTQNLLKKLPNLKVLILRETRITGSFAARDTQLWDNQLIELDISRCGSLNDEHLRDSMPYFTGLQKLHCQSTQIAAQWLRLLPTNNSLEEISFVNCPNVQAKTLLKLKRDCKIYLSAELAKNKFLKTYFPFLKKPSNPS